MPVTTKGSPITMLSERSMSAVAAADLRVKLELSHSSSPFINCLSFATPSLFLQSKSSKTLISMTHTKSEKFPRILSSLKKKLTAEKNSPSKYSAAYLLLLLPLLRRLHTCIVTGTSSLRSRAVVRSSCRRRPSRLGRSVRPARRSPPCSAAGRRRHRSP